MLQKEIRKQRQIYQRTDEGEKDITVVYLLACRHKQAKAWLHGCYVVREILYPCMKEHRIIRHPIIKAEASEAPEQQRDKHTQRHIHWPGIKVLGLVVP